MINLIIKKTILNIVTLLGVLFYLTVSIECFAAESNVVTNNHSKIHRLNWNGLDVVWIEDSRFPVYGMSVYFADGSLAETANEKGLVSFALNNLEFGTNKYSRKEIVSSLESSGTNYNATIEFESSYYSISGLVKEIIPTTKLLCHMFNDSIYPTDEIDNTKNILKANINNLIADPESLLRRVFRAKSMEGSALGHPIKGLISDIEKFNSENLKAKLQYLNNKVYKRVYLYGPSEVLAVKSIINEECGWNNQANGFKRRIGELSLKKQKVGKNDLYFVSLENATQAFIIMGSTVDKNDIQEQDLLKFSGTYLGGGYSSKLMQEVRTKRGLTYSISAETNRSLEYGRAYIDTYTKNESTLETLQTIFQVIEETIDDKFTDQEFFDAKEYLAGSLLFTLESNSHYLAMLAKNDHLELEENRISKFPDIIRSISRNDFIKKVKTVFNPDKQMIMVLGNPSLEKELRKHFTVHLINYKDYL